MRISKSSGTIRLNRAETRRWRRATLPSARGADLGRRWTMSAELRKNARELALATGRETASVITCDEEVLMVVPRHVPVTTRTRRVRRGRIG